ncbi:hypothetical protein C8R45DRAFT_925009 [Mycena sanguinolenta]|nr:hypothetical protein C8R45DRAFT_925009 [Mycena sanguinolenta]
MSQRWEGDQDKESWVGKPRKKSEQEWQSKCEQDTLQDEADITDSNATVIWADLAGQETELEGRLLDKGGSRKWDRIVDYWSCEAPDQQEGNRSMCVDPVRLKRKSGGIGRTRVYIEQRARDVTYSGRSRVEEKRFLVSIAPLDTIPPSVNPLLTSYCSIHSKMKKIGPSKGCFVQAGSSKVVEEMKCVWIGCASPPSPTSVNPFLTSYFSIHSATKRTVFRGGEVQ